MTITTQRRRAHRFASATAAAAIVFALPAGAAFADDSVDEPAQAVQAEEAVESPPDDSADQVQVQGETPVDEPEPASEVDQPEPQQQETPVAQEQAPVEQEVPATESPVAATPEPAPEVTQSEPAAKETPTAEPEAPAEGPSNADAVEPTPEVSETAPTESNDEQQSDADDADDERDDSDSGLPRDVTYWVSYNDDGPNLNHTVSTGDVTGWGISILNTTTMVWEHTDVPLIKGDTGNVLPVSAYDTIYYLQVGSLIDSEPLYGGYLTVPAQSTDEESVVPQAPVFDEVGQTVTIPEDGNFDYSIENSGETSPIGPGQHWLGPVGEGSIVATPKGDVEVKDGATTEWSFDFTKDTVEPEVIDFDDSWVKHNPKPGLNDDGAEVRDGYRDKVLIATIEHHDGRVDVVLIPQEGKVFKDGKEQVTVSFTEHVEDVVAPGPTFINPDETSVKQIPNPGLHDDEFVIDEFVDQMKIIAIDRDNAGPGKVNVVLMPEEGFAFPDGVESITLTYTESVEPTNPDPGTDPGDGDDGNDDTDGGDNDGSSGDDDDTTGNGDDNDDSNSGGDDTSNGDNTDGSNDSDDGTNPGGDTDDDSTNDDDDTTGNGDDNDDSAKDDDDTTGNGDDNDDSTKDDDDADSNNGSDDSNSKDGAKDDGTDDSSSDTNRSDDTVKGKESSDLNNGFGADTGVDEVPAWAPVAGLALVLSAFASVPFMVRRRSQQ